MNEEIFQGFTPPVSNYFRMPNEWINISAEITNLAELKVVQYVLRHTWGFQEYDGKPKPITVDEFMHGRKDRNGKRIDKGTGLKSDRSVKDGIKAAIENGYLICEVDDTDKARIVKAYALKMLSQGRQVESTPQIRQVESTSQTGRIYPSGVQNLPLNQVESTPRSEKETKERHLKKEREKDSVVPTSTQEPQPLSQPEASPSLSLEKSSQETKPTEVGYDLFDYLCRKKGYAPDFKVPRNDKNNAAIQELRQQGASAEQVEYVFNDIWNDKDPFWKQHRGKPSTVASQFTARIWKMTAPAQKRQTLTGTPNYTEDRIGKPAQKAEPAPVLHIVKKPVQPTYGPKLDQTPTYTRLKVEKPARARSLQARLQQAEEQG